MPRTITIPSGTTLSGLAKQYKTSINELMSLNPTIKDPNKIFAGATLNLPELAGTLETGGEKEKILPTQPVDKLSMFGDVLKKVTQRAAKEAVTTGREALPEGMLEPEKISGGTFASVLDLVATQKTRGISDIYESTMKMISDTRIRADKQLTMLVNTGAIADLDDKALKGLADLTDYPLDYIQSMKTVIQKEREEKATTKITDAGRISNLNTFFADKVGEDAKISAPNYIEGFKKWIGLGGAITDFKYSYPVEEWLSQDDWKNLPAGWQPKAQPTVQDIKTLPPEQQIFVQQVQNEINTGRLQYNEAVEKYPAIAVYLKAPGW